MSLGRKRNIAAAPLAAKPRRCHIPPQARTTRQDLGLEIRGSTPRQAQRQLPILRSSNDEISWRAKQRFVNSHRASRKQ